MVRVRLLCRSHPAYTHPAIAHNSTAKKAYGLTEAEILTVPHESIQSSSKTIFPVSAVAELVHRKGKFFDPTYTDAFDRTKPLASSGLTSMPRVLLKKMGDNPRRVRTNYHETSALLTLVTEVGVSFLYVHHELGCQRCSMWFNRHRKRPCYMLCWAEAYMVCDVFSMSCSTSLNPRIPPTRIYSFELGFVVTRQNHPSSRWLRDTLQQRDGLNCLLLWQYSVPR